MATSSFTATPNEQAPREDARTDDPGDISPHLRASIQVLVIEDDRTLREGCASMLQMNGYNVSSIGRGDEALELLRRRRFDIVLIDLYMSIVPGMELLGAALATDRETIVVMMTGNPSVTSSIEALRAGAWDYLPKPFSATHLQVLLGRASHAVLLARESREAQQTVLGESGNSEKVLLLGAAPAFHRAVELAR